MEAKENQSTTEPPDQQPTLNRKPSLNVNVDEFVPAHPHHHLSVEAKEFVPTEKHEPTIIQHEVKPEDIRV